ncbi:MAG: c-type cytochrome [Acidobacteriota bacterium]|nr:c-type cytochrome [Acidobacteriota bacterium]
MALPFRSPLLRITLLAALAAAPVSAQEGHGITPADIQAGGQIFLSRCANCHGPDGDFISGVNLGSNRFRRAQTDRELINIIQAGIPGTPMPPGNYTDQQAGTIVAYLHAMATAPKSTRTAGLKGDPVRGKQIVEGSGQCLNCHRVGNAGSVTGPDLSSIGGARRAADLEISLVDPDAEIRAENRTVRAVARDGSPITGTLLNQDTYSLQILDSRGKLMSLRKENLRSFELMKTSPMPSYKDKLSAQELADTVAYLVSLKGSM